MCGCFRYSPTQIIDLASEHPADFLLEEHNGPSTRTPVSCAGNWIRRQADLSMLASCRFVHYKPTDQFSCVKVDLYSSELLAFSNAQQTPFGLKITAVWPNYD